MPLNLPIPEDFGAEGDGVNDDTNAVDEWSKSCKWIACKPGSKYRITRTIVFGGDPKLTGFTLQGAGPGEVVPDSGATFLWGGARNGTMFRFTSLQFSTISGIMLDGNHTAGLGLEYTTINAQGSSHFNHFKNIVVRDCLGDPGYGIYVGSSIDQDVAQSVFEDIRLFNNNYGIYQTGIQTVAISFHNGTCLFYKRYGIYIVSGGVRIRGFDFFAEAPAIDDVYIGPTCIGASIENNYHEVPPSRGTAASAYHFPDGPGQRRFQTWMTGTRILWGPAGGSVIHYGHDGPFSFQGGGIDNAGFGGGGSGQIFIRNRGAERVLLGNYLAPGFRVTVRP